MNEPRTVVVAMCGSFCTFSRVLPQIQRLTELGFRVLPLMSFCAAGMDTRFGRAEEWKMRLYEITGSRPLETIQQAEPLGPQGLADAIIVAPCTGNTLAKLALGISDTPVTLGVKSMLRAGRPVLVALSTNDGLAASACNIGTLLRSKNYYFVPFSQDDCQHKRTSLQCDFSSIPDALACALRGVQMQPLLS